MGPPIVPIVKNNGEIRICTDAKMLNTAIMREVHHTPTIEELAIELNGAKVISKLDLRSAYNQLELDPEHRDITVFSTHMGLFRYKRLNFGISSASEEFQKTIESLISNIPKARNLSDDIIIFGNDVEEHDINLHMVLSRMEEYGLTINAKKSLFNKTSLDFFGLNFSKDGVKLTQSKIDSLLNAAPPRDIKELKSLNGLINYASKFIKDAATLLSPFHDILKRNSQFNWTEEHTNGLKLIKEALTKEAMGYFDENWNTELTTDASPTGLGAVLAQSDPADPSKRKIILYESRALTIVERKYSQVEREALAVVWACERLKLYLIGKEFNLNVNNKAVQLIFGNPKAKTCARIERWSLRLIPYKFKINHIPGITNIADYISRHATSEVKNGLDYVVEYVNSLVDFNLPMNIKMDLLLLETEKDQTLNKVKIMLDSDKCIEESMSTYFNIRAELSVSSEGLVLYGNSIVIPLALQEEVINVAHQSHQGKEKTKQLLNQFVWFKNMNSRVDKFIERCHICNCNSEKKSFQPLQMSVMPSGVWEELATDFHGPLPSGEYLMVTIDEYSRFPVVNVLKSTTAEVVINKWKETFQVFGFPKQLKTDNGPPFQSYAVRQFMLNNNISHRKITPLWPRANAICERFMRNINRVIRNSKVSGNDWLLELNIFLSQYRATPHDSTGVAPAKLVFKTQSTSSCLPMIHTCYKYKQDEFYEKTARTNDVHAKVVMKNYMDNKLKAKCHQFRVGDQVYAKAVCSNKSVPRYDPECYIISKITGTMIEARREGKSLVRNCSFFKKYVKPFELEECLLPIPVLESSITKSSNSRDSSGSRNWDKPCSTITNIIDNNSCRNVETSISQELEGEESVLDKESEKESNSALPKRIRKPVKRYSDTDENTRMQALKDKERDEKMEFLRLVHS